MSLTKEHSAPPVAPANVVELEERIHAIDPAAFFVAPRVLRRVIVHDCLLASLSIQAPDHPCYVIGHDALLDLVARDELRPSPRPVPELVMLLEAVDAEEFAARPHSDIFRDAQRLLLHARVHAAYQKLISARAFSPTVVRERIDAIGHIEFSEIRLVLRQDDLVLPPRDDRARFIEFVAVFLEQHFFDPEALSITFPSLADSRQGILAIVQQDIDLDDCLAGLNVAELSSTSLSHTQASDAGGQQSPVAHLDEAFLPTPRGIQRLLNRAERAERVGNNVRAAICYWRLGRTAETGTATGIPADALQRATQNLETLRNRLQVAIGFDDAEAQRWDTALDALLQATDQYIWPNEARLLYDLQKVCVDTEREIFTVDLSGWLAAWGNRLILFSGRTGVKLGRACWRVCLVLWACFRWAFRRWILRHPVPPSGDSEPEAPESLLAQHNGKSPRRRRYPAIPPIRRSLPAQREVLMCKHLRTAEKKLSLARINEETRQDLAQLLQRATHAAEDAMRDKLRGRLEGAFDRLGIRGQNLAERVSRKKLIEELLDQTARRGFLSIGDLRDAIARNRAKLPDLEGLGEFFRGDSLLQLNRRLSRSLDGVYRPAEVYLRWLQRISSLAFANRVGRFLTRFMALPFGGAYIILAGLQYLVDHIVHKPPVPEGAQPAPGLTSPILVLLLGVALIGVINSQRVRDVLVQVQRLFRRGMFLLIALLIDVLGLPMVRKVLRSQGFRWFVRWLAKPLLATVVVCLVLLLAGVSWGLVGWIAAGTFVVANVALNSRSGRDLEEATSEYVVRGWRSFRIVVLAGLFRWIVDWSKRVLSAVDRALYTADEWLRFRKGEQRFTLIVKAIVGFVWSLIRYVIRFAVNLLIEPQINPIKHFPIVTVSHKLLFAAAEPAANLLSGATAYTYGEALLIIGSVIWLIPGIFGFMAWELKENWRLYRANLPIKLKAVIVGHHGETMVRMLKPGFHSGTIPKAFKKLRKARRKALLKNNLTILRKAQEPLAEARHLIRDFFQREIIQLLADCSAWKHQVTLGEIHLSTNRVQVELNCDNWADAQAVISLADQSGKLVAGVENSGWMNQLDHADRLIIRNALMGLYKLCGVSVIREQIKACFPAHDFHYDIDERGLALWPQNDFTTEVIYDFSYGPILHPTLISGITPAALPTLATEEIFLYESTLPWSSWVTYWDDCMQGACPLRRMISEFRVLPAAETRVASGNQPVIAPL
ncbi:MAG: hypothetical protein MPJ50_15625 [Pirellulales bacterium]|nr:hypothetical protein [Pirellulales bacterium]